MSNPHTHGAQGVPDFRADLEVLLRLARPGEPRDAALERLARLCACCHRIYLEARLVQHVCERCRDHVRCGHCDRDFEPGTDSFGLLCPRCWPALRHLVTTVHEREPKSERAELRHQLHLAFEPRFACRWREDGHGGSKPPEAKAS